MRLASIIIVILWLKTKMFKILKAMLDFILFSLGFVAMIYFEV